MKESKEGTVTLLEDDGWCFACGRENPHGLKLTFEEKEGALTTTFRFSRKHQGYAGIVHGGLVGCVLDEVMVNLCWRRGLHAVTAGMELRFKKMVRVGETVFFRGWIEKQKGPLVITGAEARIGDGTVAATTRARCILL